MAKSDTATQLARSGTQPNNFTMMPNMAIHDLKPNAYKLLAVYLDLTGQDQIYAKNSTIAKAMGISVNTMKSARQELVDKGYILLAPGKDGAETKTASVTIQLDWMWSENHKRMSKKRVSKSDTMPSKSDTPLSNSDTNKQDLSTKTEINKTTPKPPTPDVEVVQDKSQPIDTPVSRVFVAIQQLEILHDKLRYAVKDWLKEYSEQEILAAIDTALENRRNGTKIKSVTAYLNSVLANQRREAEVQKQAPPPPKFEYYVPEPPQPEEERLKAVAVLAEKRKTLSKPNQTGGLYGTGKAAGE